MKANTRSGLAETKTFNPWVKANTRSGLSGEAAGGTDTRTQQYAGTGTYSGIPQNSPLRGALTLGQIDPKRELFVK